MSPVIYQNSCPGSLTILNDLEICFLPISLSLSLYLFFPSNYNLVVIHTRVVMHSNILRIDLVFLLRVFDIFLGISLHFLSLSNLHPPLPVSFFLYICLQCPPTTWYWSDHCSDLQTSSVVPEIFKHPLGQSCRRRRGRERERETGHWQSGTLMPINYVLGTTCTLLPPSLQHLRLGCWLVFIDIMLAYVVYISYRSIGTSRYILARLVWRMPPNCEHCPDR